MAEEETKQEEKTPPPFVVRESILLIILRLILLYILLFVINVILSVLILALELPLLFIPLILFDGFVVVFSFYMFFQWRHNYFVVAKAGIEHHFGVYERHVENYSCDNIETIMLDQDIVGKLLRHGTIKLYDPALQANIVLYNMRYPQRVSEAMKKMYLKTKKGDERSVLVRGALSS